MSYPVSTSIRTVKKGELCTISGCSKEFKPGTKVTVIHVSMPRGGVKYIRICGECLLKLAENFLREVPNFKETVVNTCLGIE